MQELLRKLGYEPLPCDRERISEWFAWYKGKVDTFHNYSQYNGKKKVRRRRATLGMAKKVCEDWANLLLNEKVAFSAGSKALTSRAEEILLANNFRVRGNQLLELSFALGTGAFVEYVEDGQVRIDYVRADKIYPLSQKHGSVTECAFCSEKVIGKKACVYLQMHVLEHGMYVIKNRLFDKNTHAPISLPDGVVSDYYTGSAVPLFQLVTPNIVNSLDPDSPMGISVYANALDVVKGVDLVFDSYQNEFRLGKKRIVVPVGMAQLHCDDTGMTPVFDDNDTEFYAFADRNLTDIREINMDIRAEQHSEGLRQALSLLSDLCGLGADRYRYGNAGIKTATEVISEESALYQNLKKHELVLEAALRDLICAVLFLDGKTADKNKVTVDFDDGIIRDSQAEFEQNLRLVEMGIMKPEEFRMWWMQESEEEAKDGTTPERRKDNGTTTEGSAGGTV